MKRAGNLIEKIADIENLYLAFWKARKGKNYAQDVIFFQKRLNINLAELRKQILNSNVNVGNYCYFTIYDPKKRKICAADFSERVLHHAIMNICHPYFEKKQIYDSYASRKNKGTYAALDKAAYFNAHYNWFLKLDFRKYFDSINHNVLKRQLQNLFKDKKLLNIFILIIDSYKVIENTGVPIGNLTSQYFANHYLSFADHFAKEYIKIPAYVRYMDDIVMWHNDKKVLLKAGYSFEKYTSEHLKLKLKPFCLNHNTHGLPFLGYLLYSNKIKLAHRSRFRFIKKFKEYRKNLKENVWSQKDFQQHIMPLFAFVEKADSKGFRKKCIETF
jgi:RNA-directed DNA polymerase